MVTLKTGGEQGGEMIWVKRKRNPCAGRTPHPEARYCEFRLFPSPRPSGASEYRATRKWNIDIWNTRADTHGRESHGRNTCEVHKHRYTDNSVSSPPSRSQFPVFLLIHATGIASIIFLFLSRACCVALLSISFCVVVLFVPADIQNNEHPRIDGRN